MNKHNKGCFSTLQTRQWLIEVSALAANEATDLTCETFCGKHVNLMYSLGGVRQGSFGGLGMKINEFEQLFIVRDSYA